MQEGDGTEIRKKVMYCFRIMSRCFKDPAKAEENFHVLDQLKDSNIWKILMQLLDPNTSSAKSSSLRVRRLISLMFLHFSLYSSFSNGTQNVS